MLGKDEIEKAIRGKEIEISLSFEFHNGKLEQIEKECNILESSARDNLYSDRLKVTMGPIVKVLNKKRIKKKCRFKNNRDLYDLGKSENKYTIKPGESIIILSNERIKLNGKYACLVVPRISLADVGIVVTTAYVDPFYNGLMRLHLSNMSDKSYELQTLEAVAQCFFFELSETVSEEFREHFSTKSVFFGQTWGGILGSDRNAFPTKKNAVKEENFSVLKYQKDMILAFFKSHSIIFMILTNFFVIGSGFIAFQQDYKHTSNAVNQMQQSLEPSASEIIIESGKDYGEKEITVECSKAEIVGIICNDANVKYQILSGDVEDKAKIIFSVAILKG